MDVKLSTLVLTHLDTRSAGNRGHPAVEPRVRPLADAQGFVPDHALSYWTSLSDDLATLIAGNNPWRREHGSSMGQDFPRSESLGYRRV